MADVEDLIDFNVIETQKENIQSLPGGRSAKSLSLLCSPMSTEKRISLSETQSLKHTVRQGFEQELTNIAEADDPLDMYDRYIKWTLDAYPSAQATPESNLLPLLERATKTFLTTSHYQNDARYLKIWLLYIRLFSDSPRETYAFLAKHNIGEHLALFYEEFAAWLEQAGRWAQAEEVYAAGLDKEARPAERLVRKYAEFQHRRETKGQQGTDGPRSPALPKVRPALAAKVDPFASAATPDRADPQARDRAASAVRPAKSGRSKLAIFADGAGGEQHNALGGTGAQGWDTIGSLSDRKKENAREARPWAGEKLNGGKKLAGPKMMVFKDEATKTNNENVNVNASDLTQRCTVNPKTGRLEYVFVNLEAVYPTSDGESGVEFCFEELRAQHRGWLDIDWRRQNMTAARRQQQPGSRSGMQNENSPCPAKAPRSPTASRAHSLQTAVPLHDEDAPGAKKSKRQERDNATRKIRVMEVRAETQTIQTNLASPTGPKLKRKKSAEPTMTFHTKEAMNEVYDIFNQTLTKVPDQDQEDAESGDDSDDDYTSAGESTGTGRISGNTTEYETDGEYTCKTVEDVITNVSGFSAFSAVKPDADGKLSLDGDDDLTRSSNRDLSVRNHFQDENLVTPTSPDPIDSTANDALDEFNAAPRPHRSQTRLPFMTPIVEKTESSLGALTAAAEKLELIDLKTPSRQPSNKDTRSSPSPSANSPWSSSPSANVTTAALQPKAAPKPHPAVPGKAHKQYQTHRAKPKPQTPLIQDHQCNPLSPTLRATVLSHIQPPLSSYPGYFDRGTQVSGRGSEIRKAARLTSRAAKGGGGGVAGTEKATVAGTAGVVKLRLEGSGREYGIRREVGRGGFGGVYLVDVADVEEAEGEKKGRVWRARGAAHEALKMEDPPSAWEFYVLRQAKRRLGVGRAGESVVEAYEMHLFRDEGFLVEQYRGQGTLLDLVNVCRAEGGAMDELLCVFFTVELFRTVEALHGKGIIHGDLKADNVLVRFDSVPEGSWSAQYSVGGGDGWSDKGITLIDFGRAIDMKVFRPDVQFIADWKTSEADCAEMREMRPWTYQIDYHGLAGVVHSMLFGKYLETVAERGAALGAGATKTYRIRESLKRYWQTELWGDVFDLLLNPLMHLDREEGKKLPVSVGMREVRRRMEDYLEMNCEKGVGLKGQIRRMEAAIRDRKK